MPKRIFIIDDADFMVDMLRIALRGAGYHVVGTAHDGEQAVNAIKVLPPPELPDIVTLDFHMPKMDGMETAACLRGLVPGVKIIMISSNATLPVVKKAKDVGIDAFIAKPFEPRVFLEILANLK